MPRDGSGVYSKPSGTTAVPNTTIESAKFNSVVDDLVTDANAARPIPAGGTGATSASAARTALGVPATADVDGKQVYAVKTGSYTALAIDNNAFHNFTGATPTLSLTAAATLGNNWHYDGYASGGPVIIDPNGAELINGASTVTVPQYCKFSVKCDASAFICVIETAQTYVDGRTTAIANSALATMSQATVKGRASGAGTGTPTDLTAADVFAIIGSLVPARPILSAGAGQIQAFSTTSGGSITLPAGGTWLAFYFGYSATTFAITFACAVQIAAGGTVYTGVAGTIFSGFVWRIA